jgi:hypothetical protein
MAVPVTMDKKNLNSFNSLFLSVKCIPSFLN